MTFSATEILFAVLLFPTVLLLINAVYNLVEAPRFSAAHSSGEHTEKFISVLIPARNEEKNIAACLDSLCSQNYSKYEIIVLDDQSDDRTAEIVKEYSLRDTGIRLISGKSLPSGWLGKNWACHQLSGEAKGEYLLFIDADVTSHPDTLKAANSILALYKPDMLSIFPTQTFTSFGDKFVVPLMNWLLLAFLPLKLVYASRNGSFIAANGQFIMISRETYKKNGGHEAVKDKVVEDMETARSVKNSGGKVMTALGYDMIYCRMYPDFISSFKGFSKNFFPGFNMHPALFVLMILFFEVLFLFPIIAVFWEPLFLVNVLAIVFIRFSVSYLSKAGILENIILHPFQMIVLLAVGINSVYYTKKKKNVWKGRKF
ncbi:MAG: glycosyltransferase [Ignavibacteriaceae bacterium]|nr:glycosyltransferase [Ignavibacteriaceae bacterium]